MPKVVTANLLSTGHVVFLTLDRTWAFTLSEADVFADKAVADESLASANIGDVVEPFVTDAGPDYTGAGAGSPAMSLRDTIRARGPTIAFLPASSDARG